MPIKGTDFVKMTNEEMKRLFSGSEKCGICNLTIQPDDYNLEHTRNDEGHLELSHRDCYFSKFSEELDKHPIGIPQMHRGQGDFSYKNI